MGDYVGKKVTIAAMRLYSGSPATSRQWRNSRLFDWDVSSTEAQVRALVEGIRANIHPPLPAKVTRKTDRQHYAAIHAIALNVLGTYYSDPKRCVAVALGSKHFRRRDIKALPFTAVLTAMQSVKLIERKRGFRDPQTKVGLVTRIRSTEKLRRIAWECQIRSYMIKPGRGRTDLIMRGVRRGRRKGRKDVQCIARQSTWQGRVNQDGKGSRGIWIMPLMIVAGKRYVEG